MRRMCPVVLVSSLGEKAMRQNWGHTQNDDQFERQECAHSASQPYTTTIRMRNRTQRTWDSRQDEGAYDIHHAIFDAHARPFATSMHRP